MEFYDQSQRLKYLYAREMARRLVERPSLVQSGKSYLEANVAPNPRMRRYYLLWQNLLEQPADEISRQLISDTPEGQQLRDSMPVFEPIETPVRERIIRESRLMAKNAAQS
jgi:hypothetical protein